ncbi:hypothetical protein [Gracilimonas sp.]|uniref:hypothetical protein n=1 Tax=Gracilimonas sp. TaxID=1974203 RepID=UPI0028718A2D|nr:hypothetical protein [Gracilimonas sp.]
MRTNLTFILLILITLFSCGNILNGGDEIDYRQEIRSFVQSISENAKSQNSEFYIIPQNGHGLLLKNGEVDRTYLSALDGLARENLFFGYTDDDQPTPAAVTNTMLQRLNIGKQAGKTILVTDYCYTPFKMSQSYSQNQALGYLSFAAPDRDLKVIPSFPSTLPGLNSNVITQLSEARNFLYLLNKSEFETREAFIEAIQNTNYDVLITDAFYDSEIFTAEEVNQLRQKANGGQRLVISYMSIGEAEDYRFYWQDEWDENEPEWLVEENPE